ncbi:glucose-6-phosphate isomerase family protein [Aerococcus tenax]|uniref:glucose-6-phosphate isomerase family protein n=1 Tax=Aerococcus tenax TaxID=3078812 RepID=UPI0018A779FB|nr:glucose-6-phosphate isomerase family protein [Aerococcus tenax]
MKKLVESGLPLFMDDDNVLALKAPLTYEGYSRKHLDKMENLFEGFDTQLSNETIYDVYRGLYLPNDVEKFKDKDYQYDITIVFPGTINGERKKTSGHYHGWNESKKNTYPEIYEVIEGRAAFILQKALNFKDDPKDLKVEDVIIAVVDKGETLIVPANYGHCSVNIGDGPLVFSNLAYTPCEINYDPVTYYNGMGYFIFDDNGEISVRKNNNYSKLPDVRFAKTSDDKKLGTVKGEPIYSRFLSDPDTYKYLEDIDPYINETFSTLEFYDSHILND